MTERRLGAVAALLDDAVARGVAPAAAAAVLAGGRRVHDSGHGTDAPRGTKGGAPVGPHHAFDVASLTKVMATGSVAATLVRDRALDLDAPAARLAPSAFHGEKGAITVRQLLAHSAGFPPTAPHAGGDLAAYVAGVPLEAPPGARRAYSDVGFVALGLVLERAGAEPLAALAATRVFEPLGLRRTSFLGARGPARPQGAIVPTVRASRPADVRRGVADDDVARAAGGATGHAGVFSTAEDVAALGQAWLDALAGRSGWLPREIALRFAAADPTPGAPRALAWDLPSGDAPAIGARLGRGPRGALGHLGFTGCSLWLDLDHELSCALVTNHCPAPGDVSAIRPLRRAFHDAIADGLGI